MKCNVLFFLIGSTLLSACAGRNFPYRDPATYQSYPSNPPVAVQNAVSDAYYGGRIVKLQHDGDWWCARTEARFKDLAEGDVSLSTWRLTCVVEAEGAEMFPYACNPVDSCDYYSLIDTATDERWEVAIVLARLQSTLPDVPIVAAAKAGSVTKIRGACRPLRHSS